MYPWVSMQVSGPKLRQCGLYIFNSDHLETTNQPSTKLEGRFLGLEALLEIYEWIASRFPIYGPGG